MQGGEDAQRVAPATSVAATAGAKRSRATRDSVVRVWPQEPDTEVHAWIARYGIRVQRSQIEGAGRGVVALVDFPQGTRLGRYRGEWLTAAQFSARYGVNGHGPYVLQLAKNKYIDSRDPAYRNWTAMINDAHGSPFTCNVIFTPRGYVRTTRHVRAGEELFADYGDEYWGSPRA